MSQILVYNHDIQKYPPIISAINALLSRKEEIIVIGYCSNKETVNMLKEQGVMYYETFVNDINANRFTKFLNLYKYKSNVSRIVEQHADSSTQLWIYGNQNAWMLHKLVEKYNTIIYLFETPRFKVSFRYKILSPSLNYAKLMQTASKIVCCEYNRAQITKAYFNLKKSPIIIPNKPDYNLIEDQQNDFIDSKELPPFGSKIILYQGIFNQPERRLDELCQAIEYLPENFFICIMGGDDENKRVLMKKYESARVKFLGYRPAPEHLQITKKAHIGFLSYFPTMGSIEASLNTLYCAPNKIFEYSRFGVPMISNDVPALRYEFNKFNAGIAVEDFSPRGLAAAILEIENNYEEYKQGALELYGSVDIKSLYISLLES